MKRRDRQEKKSTKTTPRPYLVQALKNYGMFLGSLTPRDFRSRRRSRLGYEIFSQEQRAKLKGKSSTVHKESCFSGYGFNPHDSHGYDDPLMLEEKRPTRCNISKPIHQLSDDEYMMRRNRFGLVNGDRSVG